MKHTATFRPSSPRGEGARGWGQKYAIAGVIVLVALLMLAAGVPGTAQGQSGDSSSAELLVLTKAGEFYRVDVTTGQATPFLDLQLGTREAYALAIDTAQQHAYVLTSPDCCQEIERGISHVVDVDLQTGLAQIVYKQQYLVHIHLLPGTDRIALGYYPPTLSRITGTDPVYECLLDIAAGRCDDPSGLSAYLHVNWLADETFVGTVEAEDGNGRQSYQVDLKTGASTELPVVVMAVAPLPGESRAALVTNGLGAGDFTRLDLDTLQTGVFQVQGQYDPARAFYPVSFSPDGASLLFSYDHTFQVADAETGAITSELGNVSLPQWLPDSSGLVAMSGPDFLDRTTIVLFHLGAPRGQTVTVLENVCAFAVLSS